MSTAGAPSGFLTALTEADVDAGNVVQILDGISGAFERAQLGLKQARAGRTTALDEI
jgi:hypothetical protein